MIKKPTPIPIRLKAIIYSVKRPLPINKNTNIKLDS